MLARHTSMLALVVSYCIVREVDLRKVITSYHIDRSIFGLVVHVSAWVRLRS